MCRETEAGRGEVEAVSGVQAGSRCVLHDLVGRAAPLEDVSTGRGAVLATGGQSPVLPFAPHVKLQLRMLFWPARDHRERPSTSHLPAEKLRPREVKCLGHRHAASWQGQGKNSWLPSSLLHLPTNAPLCSLYLPGPSAFQDPLSTPPFPCRCPPCFPCTAPRDSQIVGRARC